MICEKCSDRGWIPDEVDPLQLYCDCAAGRRLKKLDCDKMQEAFDNADTIIDDPDNVPF